MSKTVRKLYKMPKKDSAFFYFTLEANEGLCFYSTLPHEEGDSTRYVEISYPLGLEVQVENLISHLENEISLELQ